MGVRAFPRETSAVKLVICVHGAQRLLWVCGRTGGCGLGGRRRAAGARAEVDDERELETALLRGVETLFEVRDARRSRRRCDQPSGQAASCEPCESRSHSCWGERRHTREAARSIGGALERRCAREGAHPRGGALARWCAREAAAPGGGPARGRDAERAVKLLNAPQRLKRSLK